MPSMTITGSVPNDFSAVLRDLNALADATIVSASDRSVVLATAGALGFELRGDGLTTGDVGGRSYVSGGTVKSIVLRGEGGAVLATIGKVNLDGAVLGGWLQAEWGSSTSGALEAWMSGAFWDFSAGGTGGVLVAPFVSDDGVAVQTDGNDSMALTSLGDTVDAGGGDDLVQAGGGENFIDGGAGDDTIFGGGFSTYLGGHGNDAIYGGNRSTIQGGGGNDRIVLVGSSGAGSGASGGSGRDTVEGERGDERLKGNGGGDVIGGSYGDDRLYGSGGNDSLDGSYDEDIVVGGKGDDTCLGSFGDDTVYGDDGNDRLDGGTDHDMVYGGAGDDAVAGWTGDDRLEGGAGNDTLYGATGSDTMAGDAGDDLLYGDGSVDVLDGGEGNDLLDGGLSSDTLSGGAGADTLTGGAGADVFRFALVDDLTKADAPDIITDFETGVDVIDLAGLGVIWRGEDAFVAGAAQARWSALTGRIVLDTDGNGSGDRVIVVQGDAPLGAGDVLA
jgi:Ca2+-binding RTX toxin-like protein